MKQAQITLSLEALQDILGLQYGRVTIDHVHTDSETRRVVLNLSGEGLSSEFIRTEEQIYPLAGTLHISHMVTGVAKILPKD